MAATQKAKLAYTRKEAADATGLSPDTIDDAINAGDLVATRPTINGRQIRTVLITHDELARWIGGVA